MTANRMANTRVKIGDVVEIETKKGLSYAQYTHESEEDGSLLRVFATSYSEPPTDLAEVVRGEVAFTAFFPLRAAIKQGLVRRAGRAEITPENRIWPMFRWGIPHPVSKKVGQWYIWDGTDYWKIDSLSDEQRKWPIRSILLMEGLTTRIEEGWRPETDPR